MLNCLAASFLSPELYRKILKFKFMDGSVLQQRERKQYEVYLRHVENEQLRGTHVNASATWKNCQILWVDIIIILLTPQGGGEGGFRCEWCKSNRSSFHTFMSKFTLQCICFKPVFLVIYLTCPSWQLGHKHVLHSPGPPSVSERLKHKRNKHECYFYNTGFYESFDNSKVA